MNKAVHMRGKFAKVSACVVYVCLNVFMARAQYEDRRTFYGGLVGGLNFATVDNDNFTHYTKVGLNAGGVVFAKIKPFIAISMEMLFSQKGTSSDDIIPTGVPGTVFTYTYDKLNYVEVPVMINYFDKDRFHFGVGVSYGRLVSSKETLETSPPMYIQTDQYPFNKEDYELLIGGQFKVYQNLFLTVRWQYSIVQIRNNVPTNFVPTEQNNNLFVLRTMYLFK